jgi:hypothetical protein
MALMLVVSSVDFQGVSVRPAIVMAGTAYERRYEFWQVALFSILLVITVCFLLSCFRQLVRKAKGMEVFVSKDQKPNERLTMIPICWVFCIIWSCLCYWQTGKLESLTIGILGSGCLLCFAGAFTYFALNEFEYFQDIEKLNRKIDMHNKKIDGMEATREKLQKDLCDGKLNLPNIPNQKFETLSNVKKLKELQE